MTGRHATEDRATRDARVLAAAQHGVTTVEIAETERLSDRQVRRILSAAEDRSTGLRRGTPAPGDKSGSLAINPFDIRDAAITTHLEALASLRTLAASARHEATRVGAAKAAVGTAMSLVGLLERVGMAPPTAASWWNEASWQLVWLGMADALYEVGIEDPTEFAWVAARHAGVEVGIGNDARLVGLGPRFDREVPA